MARKKEFNVHDLYPTDYCFDWETFQADPEHYVFTRDDIAYWNAMELQRYENETPMTPYERRALRKWVSSGHSVGEAPPSKYRCTHGCCPPPDFLDVYREDRMLDAVRKRMNRAEREAYLKEYFGFCEEPEEERLHREHRERLHRETPEEAKNTIRNLQRRIFYLYMFISEQGLSSEADEYLDDHLDTPTPFEDEW